MSRFSVATYRLLFQDLPDHPLAMSRNIYIRSDGHSRFHLFHLSINSSIMSLELKFSPWLAVGSSHDGLFLVENSALLGIEPESTSRRFTTLVGRRAKSAMLQQMLDGSDHGFLNISHSQAFLWNHDCISSDRALYLDFELHVPAQASCITPPALPPSVPHTLRRPDSSVPWDKRTVGIELCMMLPSVLVVVDSFAASFDRDEASDKLLGLIAAQLDPDAIDPRGSLQAHFRCVKVVGLNPRSNFKVRSTIIRKCLERARQNSEKARASFGIDLHRGHFAALVKRMLC
jgi:hypothetical protein